MSPVNKSFFESLSIMLSTTLGAGIFALPYVFKTAGWLLGALYLALMSLFVIAVHILYIRVLSEARGRHRLLGLVKLYFGRPGYYTAFFAVVIGLLLTLLAYLTIVGSFISLLVPGLPASWGLWIFWATVSILLFLGVRRLGGVELFGGILMVAIILIIFFMAPHLADLEGTAVFNEAAMFLPFGAVLFALAAWPAIEPIYELDGKSVPALKKGIKWGTIFAAILYFIFVLGIMASSNFISTDAMSGFGGWPAWKLRLIGLLGIFLILTSYVPIGFEIKNALEKDLSVPFDRLGASPSAWALLTVILIPPLLFISGLDNFLGIVELVGGLFLSLQYFFIILVARKTLNLNKKQKILYDIIALVFFLAAIYEAIIFTNREFFG